ncbi:MAG: M23 family metallopeptidase [Rickettsiales bacterium]|jgi:murein DD-endopeptidase MepM/ murein hydrolase activator NlpD|nr:M23 family metallopeptidase [Rickettsiales bacterium]
MRKAKTIAHSLPSGDTGNSFETRKHRLGRGESLFGLLTYELKLSKESVTSSLEALEKVFNVKHLRVGQEISISYRVLSDTIDSKNGITKMELEELKILDDKNSREIVVLRDPGGGYWSRKNKIGATTYYDRFFVEIKNNLYSDAVLAGVPASVVVDLINLYSFDMDFQRDIRAGDKLEIVFESQFLEATGRTKNGNIIYANLSTGGVNHKIYRFGHRGTGTYFDENGLGVKKSLLRTPIDGARITSGYGKRRHPILGYTKAHQGVDFAAPIGTPFYAAGNGVVTKVVSNCRERDRSCGDGYGNYLLVRHNSIYSSEYAHLSRVAKNIKVGSRVSQGEVIGFVGNTGLATGPHLHYGLLQKNTRINPSNIKPISYVKLNGRELSQFLQERNRLDNFKISSSGGTTRNINGSETASDPAIPKDRTRNAVASRKHSRKKKKTGKSRS